VQLFVDYLDAAGEYTSAKSACSVDPALPVSILIAPVFLSAMGHTTASPARRVFHVEGGRFLDASTLSECEVDELDTLIIVNGDTLTRHEHKNLRHRWWTTGGAIRRCGDMTTPPPTLIQ